MLLMGKANWWFPAWLDRSLPRIHVEPEETSAGLDARQDFLRMTAEAERAIGRQFAGSGREDFENLRDHDRPMTPRRGLPRRQHLRHGLRVSPRIALLVFFLEAPRILARVTRTAAVRGGFGSGVRHAS